MKIQNINTFYSTKKLHKENIVLGEDNQGNNGFGDNDFELWDRNSQIYDSQLGNDGKRWKTTEWCKPSCLLIAIILTIIILVALVPLFEQVNGKSSLTKSNRSPFICTDKCRIQLVESIPEGLNYSHGIKFKSTFEAWNNLLDITNQTLDLASFYWTLRGSDVYNHTSAQQGEKIFQKFLNNGITKKYQLRIVQSEPTPGNPNLETEYLAKKNFAEIRSVNLPRLIGGGVLHTKLWIADGQHFYIGSANMDWRSLTQVKELGVLVTNCTCLAKDMAKIFKAYWFLGTNYSHIPADWPDEYSTEFNMNTPINVIYNDKFSLNTFIASSPPPIVPKGRASDLDAIIHTILEAEKFVYISVMEYSPLIVFSPKIKFWPAIDNALRKAAIENKVSIKLLISQWEHSHPSEEYFLKSLKTLSNAIKGVDIQVRRFIVPADDDQSKIPFARVNHNKYMVTDNTAYIGTSNWSGDYFENTAGVGLVIRENPNPGNVEENGTIRYQLVSIFERDWNSKYAVED